jgi:uncharacterized membrane protein YcaP (DUF421 family)
MTNCYGGVIVICMMHRFMGWLKQRSPRIGAIIDGTPVLLLKDERWQSASMDQTRVDDNDVMAAARGKGIKTLAQIKYAVLERNGAITVIKKNK